MYSDWAGADEGAPEPSRNPSTELFADMIAMAGSRNGPSHYSHLSISCENRPNRALGGVAPPERGGSAIPPTRPFRLRPSPAHVTRRGGQQARLGRRDDSPRLLCPAAHAGIAGGGRLAPCHETPMSPCDVPVTCDAAKPFVRREFRVFRLVGSYLIVRIELTALSVQHSGSYGSLVGLLCAVIGETFCLTLLARSSLCAIW